jgi:hypothetical protein
MVAFFLPWRRRHSLRCVATTRLGGVSRRQTTAIVTVLAVTALGATGCGSIARAIANKATHGAFHGDAAINTLTAKMQSSSTTPHEVVYVTTGSAPTTITYATAPPRDLAFDGTESGGGLEVLQNSTGEYACTRSPSSSASSHASWSCTKLGKAAATTYHAMYALYTGAYWIDFLKIYSTVAGLSGVTVKSTSMKVNGFDLQCVVVRGGKNNPSTSTWCVTSSGILGYVSVSGNGSAFEIKSYSSAPPRSLFKLPAGATITTLPASS